MTTRRDPSRCSRGNICLLIVAIVTCLIMAPGALVAQDGGGGKESRPAVEKVLDPGYNAALQRGNKAYNDGDYVVAIKSYTQAIQAAPLEADPYRNMARAYFWQGDYNASLAYYDVYLVTFPDAKDSAQIQRERRLTSDRSKKPWTLPEQQRVAMRALEDRIDVGPAYTMGGGGAWKAYQQLLRTGYAQPGLSKLRERLFKSLVDEFDTLIVAKQGQPAPHLDLATWELQMARLEAASRVINGASQRDALARRKPIAEAALALQLSRFDEAADRAQVASEANPDLIFLRWFRVTALLRANEARAALEVLDALRPVLSEKDPSQLEYHRVVRAMILQRLDRHDDAASIYIGIFEGN